EHRIELVGSFADIRFYNDSLATIPQATVNALVGLGEHVATLIAGGYDRGVSYAPLGQAIAERTGSLRALILFPTTGEKILRSLEEALPPGAEMPLHFFAASMEEAVDFAYRHTPPGKICLLSPASSSFNMFKDYQDRGERFKQCVTRMDPGAAG